ncbi:MAG: hypothetical protein J0H79_15280 [Alphaproteobacteria bacterium]|nr:hypothetical protein [Alphaproteobacteria bacterium]
MSSDWARASSSPRRRDRLVSTSISDAEASLCASAVRSVVAAALAFAGGVCGFSGVAACDGDAVSLALPAWA